MSQKNLSGQSLDSLQKNIVFDILLVDYILIDEYSMLGQYNGMD